MWHRCIHMGSQCMVFVHADLDWCRNNHHIIIAACRGDSKVTYFCNMSLAASLWPISSKSSVASLPVFRRCWRRTKPSRCWKRKSGWGKKLGKVDERVSLWRRTHASLLDQSLPYVPSYAQERTKRNSRSREEEAIECEASCKQQECKGRGKRERERERERERRTTDRMRTCCRYDNIIATWMLIKEIGDIIYLQTETSSLVIRACVIDRLRQIRICHQHTLPWIASQQSVSVICFLHSSSGISFVVPTVLVATDSSAAILSFLTPNSVALYRWLCFRSVLR